MGLGGCKESIADIWKLVRNPPGPLYVQHATQIDIADHFQFCHAQGRKTLNAGAKGGKAISSAVGGWVERLGKPGMFLGLARAVSVGAIMASFLPGGLDRYNATIAVHVMPELKIDWSRLVLARFAEQCGIIPQIGGSAIIWVLCRGPECHDK